MSDDHVLNEDSCLSRFLGLVCSMTSLNSFVPTSFRSKGTFNKKASKLCTLLQKRVLRTSRKPRKRGSWPRLTANRCCSFTNARPRFRRWMTFWALCTLFCTSCRVLLLEQEKIAECVFWRCQNASGLHVKLSLSNTALHFSSYCLRAIRMAGILAANQQNPTVR